MAEESNHAGAPVGDSECVICTEPAKYRCPECMERDYCSRDCQVLDWKEKGHKRSCPRTARYWASHKQIAPAPQQQQEKEKEIETTKQNDEQTNKQTGGQEKVDSPHLQPQPRQRGLQNVAEPGTLETERVQPTSVVPNPPIANSQPTQPQSKGYVLSPRITEQGQTRGVSQSQGKGAQAQATLSPTPAIHRSPHLPVRQNSTPRPLAAKPQKSPLATHPPTTECHKSTGFPLTMPSNQNTSSEQPTGVTLESFLAHQQQQLREHLPAPLSPSAPTQQKSHPHPAPSDAHPPTRTHAQPSAPAPQAAQDYARGRDMFMRMFGPTAPPAAPPVDILPLPTDPFADIELDPPFDNSSRKRQRIDSRAPTTHPPPEKPPADDDEFCTLADMLPEQENEQASAKHTEGGQGGTGGRAGRQPGAMQNSGLGGPGASMGLQRQRSVNTGPKRRQPLLVFPRQATFFGPFAFEAMVQHQSQHMHQHQAQMAQPVMQQQPAEAVQESMQLGSAFQVPSNPAPAPTPQRQVWEMMQSFTEFLDVSFPLPITLEDFEHSVEGADEEGSLALLCVLQELLCAVLHNDEKFPTDYAWGLPVPELRPCDFNLCTKGDTDYNLGGLMLEIERQRFSGRPSAHPSLHPQEDKPPTTKDEMVSKSGGKGKNANGRQSTTRAKNSPDAPPHPLTHASGTQPVRESRRIKTMQQQQLQTQSSQSGDDQGRITPDQNTKNDGDEEGGKSKNKLTIRLVVGSSPHPTPNPTDTPTKQATAVPVPAAAAAYSTTACEYCLHGDHDEMMLLCDYCDRGYHTYCLDPPLQQIPEGNWYCHICAAGGLDGRFASENDEEYYSLQGMAVSFKTVPAAVVKYLMLPHVKEALCPTGTINSPFERLPDAVAKLARAPIWTLPPGDKVLVCRALCEQLLATNRMGQYIDDTLNPMLPHGKEDNHVATEDLPPPTQPNSAKGKRRRGTEPAATPDGGEAKRVKVEDDLGPVGADENGKKAEEEKEEDENTKENGKAPAPVNNETSARAELTARNRRYKGPRPLGVDRFSRQWWYFDSLPDRLLVEWPAPYFADQMAKGLEGTLDMSQRATLLGPTNDGRPLTYYTATGQPRELGTRPDGSEAEKWGVLPGHLLAEAVFCLNHRHSCEGPLKTQLRRLQDRHRFPPLDQTRRDHLVGRRIAARASTHTPTTTQRPAGNSSAGHPTLITRGRPKRSDTARGLQLQLQQLRGQQSIAEEQLNELKKRGLDDSPAGRNHSLMIQRMANQAEWLEKELVACGAMERVSTGTTTEKPEITEKTAKTQIKSFRVVTAETAKKGGSAFVLLPVAPQPVEADAEGYEVVEGEVKEEGQGGNEEGDTEMGEVEGGLDMVQDDGDTSASEE